MTTTEDDYNSGDDDVATIAVTTAATDAAPTKLSRRKRKREKLEAKEAEAQAQPKLITKVPQPSADNDNHTAGSDGGVPLIEDDETEGKRKRKRRKKGTGAGAKASTTSQPDGSSLNEDVAHMDQQLMADYVSQRIRRWEKDLSFVELEDKLLPERYFVDTSSFKLPRELKNMSQYMEIFCSKKGQSTVSHLKSSPKQPGSPHTLIIAPAALRAADLVRSLRCYQTKDSAVAKFFAKHIKLAESIQFAKENRIGIAVGTPARLAELLKDGCLQTKYIQRVVLDVSYVDTKRRGLFDMKEVGEKVMEVLGMETIRKRLEGGDRESGDMRGVLFF